MPHYTLQATLYTLLAPLHIAYSLRTVNCALHTGIYHDGLLLAVLHCSILFRAASRAACHVLRVTSCLQRFQCYVFRVARRMFRITCHVRVSQPRGEHSSSDTHRQGRTSCEESRGHSQGQASRV